MTWQPPEKSRVKRLCDAVPLGRWLVLAEIHMLTGDCRVTESIQTAVRRGLFEKSGISPDKFQRAMDLRSKNDRRPFTIPRLMYRKVEEYWPGRWGPDGLGQTKLTKAQRAYINRNPDRLTARQMAPFFPVTRGAISGLLAPSVRGKYDVPELSDDELRELAFPDGVTAIEQAKRLPAKKRPERQTSKKYPSDHHPDRWDLTKFG